MTKGDPVDGGPSADSRQQGRHSLLRKFGIKIEELDYNFVKTCTDSKKLEHIFRILESGEEGYYPHLENFARQKLENVDPENRHLRTETPVLHPTSLPSAELSSIEQDLNGWIQSTSAAQEFVKDIFAGGDAPCISEADPPIRHAGVIDVTTGTNALLAQGTGEDGIPFLKPSNPNRIKSWEYDKWNKFDVDTEIMKLDIQEMQKEEQLRVKDLTTTNKLRQNDPSSSSSSLSLPRQPSPEQAKPKKQESPRPCCSKSLSSSSSTPIGPSYIEEIQEPKKELKPRRRVKIFIDDVSVNRHQ